MTRTIAERENPRWAKAHATRLQFELLGPSWASSPGQGSRVCIAEGPQESQVRLEIERWETGPTQYPNVLLGCGDARFQVKQIRYFLGASFARSAMSFARVCDSASQYLPSSSPFMK